MSDWKHLSERESYTVTLHGDGTVPHSLGFLSESSRQIPTYFVDCWHGALANNEDVIAGTLQLLAGGPCSLPTQPPKMRGVATAAVLDKAPKPENRRGSKSANLACACAAVIVRAAKGGFRGSKSTAQS